MLDSDVGGANISTVDVPLIDGDRDGMLQLKGECLSCSVTLILAEKKEREKTLDKDLNIQFYELD